MKRPGLTRALATSLFLTLLPGCATIMQGSRQQMAISSNPSGAQVFLNGVERGMTPMVADLSRKEKHVITL